MTGLGITTNSPQAVISYRSYLNPQGATQQALVNYESVDSLQAAAAEVHTVTVAASTSNASFALATLFPAMTAPIYLAVTEIAASGAGLGFKITTASNASGKMGVAPSGVWAYVGDGSTALPTIYIDNASSTTALVLSIAAMTQ